MKKKSVNSLAGFTLVELLIGATLSAAIMAAVLSSYIYLGRNLTRLANQQTLEIEGRRTLGYFSQDAQAATNVTAVSLTAPDFSVIFMLAGNGGGADRVTYYYSRDGNPNASISNNTIAVPANSLVRVLGTANAITQPVQVILRNIVPTNDGCYIRFYDFSGSAHDNGSVPYTPVLTYSLGIKQVSISFSTQVGNLGNGTRTLIYQVASGRLVLRNKGLLQ